MKHVCKKPYRQGKPLRAAMDYLRRLGASAIDVLHNKHLHLAWEYRGIRFVIPVALSCRGRDAAATAIWAIRTKLRRAGFAAAACA